MEDNNTGGPNPSTLRDLTFGEKAVGLTFNPGNNVDVDAIKKQCAELIDTLNKLREEAGQGERGRMFSVAITEIQTAQMWAVKAVTWQY